MRALRALFDTVYRNGEHALGRIAALLVAYLEWPNAPRALHCATKRPAISVHPVEKRSKNSLKLFFGLCAVIPTLVSAGQILVGPKGYSAAVQTAKAGDVIRLKPGVYTNGLVIHGMTGTPTANIVIEAADFRNPPRFIARLDRNTVSIVDASYISIRNLVLDGQNFPVDAVKAEGYSRFAHHITLEGLRIVRHGVNQGVVGISTKCPAWGWIIRRNVIGRAGTGMYLGNSDGSAPFFDGVIEHNFVYDTLGYNLQIKHQQPRPTLSEMPHGPHTTVIRHNVFSKFGNGTTGHLARPNVLVGHFPREGSGVDDQYAIYANFFYANPTEALFQGEGNIALYANVFVNSFGDAVHIQPHNDVPKNIWVFRNTVIANGAGIALRGSVTEYLKLMAANAVFASVPPAHYLQTGNVVGSLEQARNVLNDAFAPLGHLNLKPKATMVWTGEADMTHAFSFPDAKRDFDGEFYQERDAGAYATSPVGPQWFPVLSIKPLIKQPWLLTK